MTQLRHIPPEGEPEGRPRRTRHMGRGRPLARVAALVLTVALALQGALGGGTHAGAAQTQTGDSIYLTVGERIWYGGQGDMGTARMSANGEVAYCADPENNPPKSGYYTREPVKTAEGDGWHWPVESVERVLFYGYGGPGFDAELWRGCIGGTDGRGRHFAAGRDWDGSDITEDEFYAYTHVLLSDRVTNDGSVALAGTSESFRAWFCWNVLGYTYGNAGGNENQGSVGLTIDRMSVPDGFEAYQLDTGYNSMWVEGARSQIVVTFEYNPSVEVRFDKVSADAELTSGNSEYAYAGATYDVYEADGDVKVASITTDERGRASCTLKPNTSYYAVETAAPQGFVRSDERVAFDTGTSEETVSLEDAPGTVELRIVKRDSATLGEAQPGVSLAGAEYRAVDANGDAHTATTDESGRAVFSGLPLGELSVTETKAPEGYLPDTSVHEYQASASTLPESGVIELEPTGDFDEHVVAFDLDLVKYRDGGTEGSGLQQPAAGVRFEVVSGTTGEVVATLATDEHGFATTEGGWFGAGERPEGVHGAIPYDREGYTVREVASTTPEGYQSAPDWHVTPEQMLDGVTLHYIVDNDFVASRIQVVKVDAASGRAVPLAGFTFQLLDADGNELEQDVWYPNHEQLSEFTTDETGCVTFPGRLRPGTYRIRETAAVAPYLSAGGDLSVTIGNAADTPPVSVVSFADDQARGAATIVKRCSADEAADAGHVCDPGCDGLLAGAEFDVVARQDVVSPDGTTQAVEGEVVAHVTTDESGSATVRGLPLGQGSATYAFVETRPATGHALDATPHEFTLAYADDDTPVVTAAVEASNEPTVVALDKTVLGTGEPLSGATFALWLEEPGGGDGGGGTTGERTLVTTDDGGTITLRHLRPGTYCLAEVDPPEGYLADGVTRTFTVDETGLVEGSPSLALSAEDDFTKVELSKRDITNEAEVPGARLSVLDAEGNVVESWVSAEGPHLIEALPVGTYTLVEEMTPHDYDEATAVEFSVAETGEVQTVVMYDRPIDVSGELDKRQEVAGGAGTCFDYSVDARSTSSTWVDEFTVTDELDAVSDGLAVLDGITTPVASGDYDGMLNVWYRTDLAEAGHVDESGANATLSDGHANPWLQAEETGEQLGDDGRVLSYEGWRLWAQDVSTTEATALSVSDLELAEGEKVVAVRLEYGRVNPGFTTRSEDWERDGLKDARDDVSDVTATHEGDLTDEGTERAPLVVHMTTTDAYRDGARLLNRAQVDLYRNGGGEGLEGHDDDLVEQGAPSPAPSMPTPLARTGEATLPVAGVATLGFAAVLLSLRRRRR